MKKHTLFVSNLIIVLFISVGFFGVLYKDTRAYQELAESHLEGIVRLASNDIYKNIEDSMSKPFMVSQTMASDSFLKDWLSNEPANIGDETYMQQIYNYLLAYQQKYDYTTVFCVSAQTSNYYYQDGMNKVISKDDEHDVWYYNFIDSKKAYDLEVDTNEADAGQLSVFVNFRVEREDGSLLGVIGVGLLVSSIEETIQMYEEDYDLSVYVINVGGAKNSFLGATDIFIKEEDIGKATGINDEIVLDTSGNTNLQWFTSDDERICIITRYDSTLGWHLVYEKETNSIMYVFRDRLLNNIINLLVSLIACIVAMSIVNYRYNQRVIRIENTDDLTGLSNRKLFKEKQLEKLIKKKEVMSMFIFDVDNFKMINDTKGHMFGNAVLAMVGESIRTVIKDKGSAARWGGDEFFGILSMDAKEAQKLIKKFMKMIEIEGCKMNHNITVSVGIIEVDHSLSLDKLFEKADEALYQSKENGRNKITIGS